MAFVTFVVVGLVLAGNSVAGFSDWEIENSVAYFGTWRVIEQPGAGFCYALTYATRGENAGQDILQVDGRDDSVRVFGGYTGLRTYFRVKLNGELIHNSELSVSKGSLEAKKKIVVTEPEIRDEPTIDVLKRASWVVLRRVPPVDARYHLDDTYFSLRGSRKALEALAACPK